MKNLKAQVAIVMIGMRSESNSTQAGSFVFDYIDHPGNHTMRTLNITNLIVSPSTDLELATSGTMILAGTGNASAYHGDYSLVLRRPDNTPDPSYYYNSVMFTAKNSPPQIS